MLFNLSMVGKQGWLLIEHLDSLSTTRKKHASHTWHAILARREVLQKGLIRRSNDGSSTKIWDDWWITNHFGGGPITSTINVPMTMVVDLLTLSGGWST